MAFEVIPISTEPSISEEVVLDNISFRLRFNYNNRADYWTIDFFTPALLPICTGFKIVLNYELINRFPDRGLPPGEIWAIDTSETHARVDRDNFGNDVALIYVPKADL